MGQSWLRFLLIPPLRARCLQAPGSSRDLLLLDIALESWLRMLVERQDKRNLSGDDLVELMGLVLGNAALAGTSAELELVTAQWEAVRACPDRWVVCRKPWWLRGRCVLTEGIWEAGLVLGNAALAGTLAELAGGSTVGGCQSLP